MNILIVDDSPTKALDIKKSIEYLNAKITIVGTGSEAMMEIMVEEFDYMISDMQFPWSGSEIEDTCGIHLQQELLDSGVKLPTIICSSVKRNLDFDNVFGYIIYQGHDMEKFFQQYIK